ncbi:MAG: DegQ family serine endoprotease [Alphaproteobacteria bacterium]|nr:DegQ family serine endoprotease [Alphaproteobacteria bacterium]
MPFLTIFAGRMGKLMLAGAVSLAVIGMPFVPARAAEPAIIQIPSFAPIVKRVLPAVVNISVTEKSDFASNDNGDDGDQGLGPNANPFQGFPPSPFDQFLRRFFQQQQRQFQEPNPGVQRIALGSGFIIDPSGYVVTNNHVVQDATKVTVILQDGSRHPAKIIGRDPKTDLALLKIESSTPLPYVSWGDSGAAQVGDWVVAVGNPFGLGGTISTGVISARGRDIHAGPYDDFLQIDASINRGNSGGPDFNLEGQVIGINTAIYSPNGGSVGIGFAIPSSLAKPIIEQLREHGKVERGWLGVQIQSVTPDIASSLGLPKQEGALVADVTKHSPAAAAGVKQGDVILSYEGHDIERLRDLPIAVAETQVGQTAAFKVWRDHKEVTLHAKIAEMPANIEMAQASAKRPSGATSSSMGVRLSSLTPELRRRAHVPNSVKGVIVTHLDATSPLAAVGVQPGDVIEQINQKPVYTPKEAMERLETARKQRGPNKTLLLLLNRQGVNEYVALSVENGGAEKG